MFAKVLTPLEFRPGARRPAGASKPRMMGQPPGDVNAPGSAAAAVASGTAAGTSALTANANRYYRRVRVTNLM